MKKNAGRSHKRYSLQAHRELWRRPGLSKLSKMGFVAADDKGSVMTPWNAHCVVERNGRLQSNSKAV